MVQHRLGKYGRGKREVSYMVTCPSCKKQLNGNPRSCGYCGNSLVSDYFRQQPQERQPLSPPGTGAIAALTLGIFGSIALLSALLFQLAPLFGYGIMPELNAIWWIRALSLSVGAMVYFVQIVALRGVRGSLLPDSLWLFLSACGLSLTIQAYLDQGSLCFYGLTAIPYLLVLGCSLMLVASITSILAYRK